jgi:hypothetical protein
MYCCVTFKHKEMKKKRVSLEGDVNLISPQEKTILGGEQK